MSCLRWLAVVLVGGPMLASVADARSEVLSWSHEDPCSVERFEVRMGADPSGLDTVIDVGRPRQAGGHFSYELEVPDGQETWVCVAAIRDGETSSCSGAVALEASSQDDLRSEPAPDAARNWCDDFQSGLASGWRSTGSNESLAPAPGLFTVGPIGSGGDALTTSSEAENIHSHFLGAADGGLSAADWSEYEYSGQMLVTEDGGGVGVTLYSGYDTATHYYRLGRDAGTGRFELERARTDPTWKCLDVGPVQSASPNQWIAFRLRVRNEGVRTSLGAKLWPADRKEPEGFQISCTDSRTDRPLSGAVGIWASGDGTKAWDSLHVSSLTSPDPSDPLGIPGRPELVLP